MKKIMALTMVLLFAGTVFASCDPNEYDQLNCEWICDTQTEKEGFITYYNNPSIEYSFIGFARPYPQVNPIGTAVLGLGWVYWDTAPFMIPELISPVFLFPYDEYPFVEMGSPEWDANLTYQAVDLNFSSRLYDYWQNEHNLQSSDVCAIDQSPFPSMDFEGTLN